MEELRHAPNRIHLALIGSAAIAPVAALLPGTRFLRRLSRPKWRIAWSPSFWAHGISHTRTHSPRRPAWWCPNFVTNAVVHAEADSGVLQLGIRADQDGSLHVAVSNGSAVLLAVKELAGDAEGGLGLPIVVQLSARWGVESTDAGATRVWVELR